MSDAPRPVPDDDLLLRQAMARYQAGDALAFDDVYRLTRPMVLGHLAVLTIDRSATHDLVQEVYLQVHRSRHTYDGSRPVRPWIAGITRHVWLMAKRSYARRRAREVAGLDEVLDLSAAPVIDALGARAELTRALIDVHPEQREALVLHHLFGLSFREAGRVLGISEGAARIRASRAMATLRTILGGTRG